MDQKTFFKDFNTIGITLGSLGLGQLLPFFYFDHFVANKLLGINPTYKVEDGTLVISYAAKPGIEVDQQAVDNFLVFAYIE
jgi:hypothetical protein